MNELIEQTQHAIVTREAPTQAVALAAAVLDKRIMTARQFPRSIARFKNEAIQLLQNDIETARNAEYSKRIGDGTVRGPSIRLAEIVTLCWTNLEVDICEPVVSDKSVTVQAFAWDLERNIRVAGIATMAILTKEGIRYPQHLIETTVLACASKARRNAIISVVPRAYINDLVAAAREVANKNAKPLEQARVDMLEYFARNFRVDGQQLYDYLQVSGIDDIGAEQMEELRGVVAALKEGESVEAYFGKAKSKADLAREKVAARRAKTEAGED